MKYVNLGRSGLKVSRLCLGCMSYGEPERLPQPWSLDEKASRPLIRQALEAGINFFDTANIYSGGSSEEITGKALREMARRDEIVVATKTFFPWRNSPNTGFLSRKAIFKSIDDSLMRLGMDYVDLFQIHRFDYSTPVEETMEALHDVVKAGSARSKNHRSTRFGPAVSDNKQLAMPGADRQACRFKVTAFVAVRQHNLPNRQSVAVEDHDAALA